MQNHEKLLCTLEFL